VFHDIGERLAHHEVRDALDIGRPPPLGYVEMHDQRKAFGYGLQGRRKTSLRESGWVEPVSQIPQFGEGFAQLDLRGGHAKRLLILPQIRESDLEQLVALEERGHQSEPALAPTSAMVLRERAPPVARTSHAVEAGLQGAVPAGDELLLEPPQGAVGQHHVHVNECYVTSGGGLGA